MPRNWLLIASVFCAPSILMAYGKTFFENSAIFAHYLFVSKPKGRSLDNGVSFHTRNFRKLYGNVFNFINNHFYGYTPVSLLLFFGRPFAIFWRVSKFIVNSVQRITFWSRTHVANKIMKSCLFDQPTITNGNSSPSIVAPLAKLWIVAPINHASPYYVKWVGIFKRHIDSFQMELLYAKTVKE